KSEATTERCCHRWRPHPTTGLLWPVGEVWSDTMKRTNEPTSLRGLHAAGSSVKVAAGDVARGFFEVTHNGLALMGTALAVSLIVLGARSDLRANAEQQLLSWL